MVADMSTCVPQDISNSLWAYATLRRHPGDPLLDAAAARAVAVAARFKPQEVANTLWSYAALGHDPGPALLDALAAHAAAGGRWDAGGALPAGAEADGVDRRYALALRTADLPLAPGTTAPLRSLLRLSDGHAEALEAATLGSAMDFSI
jgi:hypothetical protein